MLDLSSHNPASFLVDAFIVPERVELFQRRSNSVVFADPNGVHGGQLRLFVDSSVAFNLSKFEQMNVSHFKRRFRPARKQNLCRRTSEHSSALTGSKVSLGLALFWIKRRPPRNSRRPLAAASPDPYTMDPSRNPVTWFSCKWIWFYLCGTSNHRRRVRGGSWAQ